MSSKKLHIILDLDETLLYFIKPRNLWDNLSKKEKSKYRIADSGKDGLFILRPYLKEFLSFLFKNKHIDVSIWTWSDAEYAIDVANLLTDNEPKLFANIWSSDDAAAAGELYGNSKDLNYLWYDLSVKGFMPSNTILIDDLDANVDNTSNKKNAIQVPAFDLFGTDKPRQKPYKDYSEDATLLNVIDVIKGVLASPNFCRDGDLPHPFKSLKKVSRNKVGTSRAGASRAGASRAGASRAVSYRNSKQRLNKTRKST